MFDSAHVVVVMHPGTYMLLQGMNDDSLAVFGYVMLVFTPILIGLYVLINKLVESHCHGSGRFRSIQANPVIFVLDRWQDVISWFTAFFLTIWIAKSGIITFFLRLF